MLWSEISECRWLVALTERTSLVPSSEWSEITDRGWFLTKTKGGMWMCWEASKPRKSTRLTIVEKGTAAEEKEAVTAVLSRFVPVYDHNGALLAKPTDADMTARAALHSQERSRFMFQFDLQSLLLLAVVVSCAASCYGIHFRRLRPYREAISHLRTLQPWWRDNVVGVPTSLDFSMSAKKPTDSDLTCLEPLADLRSLDLSGAPITDAGLVHLMGLKRLSHINLVDTGITSKGAAELSRAPARRPRLLRFFQIPWRVQSYQPPRRGPARGKVAAGRGCQSSNYQHTGSCLRVYPLSSVANT